MRKLFVVLALVLGGFSFACTSTVAEVGVESDFSTANPYLRLQCNIYLEPLSISVDDAEFIGVWLRPEVFLTPVVERVEGSLSFLVDVPWPAQFIVKLSGSVRDGPLLAVAYRQVW